MIMALAAFGAHTGLTEQQIVDLIVHHRSLYARSQRTTPGLTSNGPSRRHFGPVLGPDAPMVLLGASRFPPRPVRLRRRARPLRRVQVDRPIVPPSILRRQGATVRTNLRGAGRPDLSAREVRAARNRHITWSWKRGKPSFSASGSLCHR